MRLAALDVGSNTVHLVVVDGRADGTFAVVGRERDTLRLADAAFPSMSLPEEAVQRLVASVARMRAVADRLDAGAMVGFATSAIREARNGLDVLGRVRELIALRVHALALLGPLADQLRERPWDSACASWCWPRGRCARA